MKRGRRRIENPETARRILNAAEMQFAAGGLAGARTDEIAACARANKAMLYYYFGNKQKLHHAVLENLFRQLGEVVFKPPRPGSTSRDQLLQWFNGYFDFLASHPNYQRLVQREAMNVTPKFKRIAREFFRPFHRHIGEVIARGVASGEFRSVDPQQTVFSLLGMTAFYFAAAPVMSQIAGHNLLSRQALEGRRRALLDFIEHGLIRGGAHSR